MGLFDTLRQAYKGAVEPEQLAEELIGRPWTVSLAALNALATTRQDFRAAFGSLGHLYRLERLTVVNNNGTAAIKVRPNADLLREVRIGAGGGSATIDHGDIQYLEVENVHATENLAAGDVILYGEAFKRH